MSTLALSFHDVKFNPVQHNHQVWITASELAQALGYKKSDAVTQVYERNSEEFTPNMTQTIENPQALNLRVRIFSLRGCHLIAMFSKTSVAKEFRKWVLDILDRQVNNPSLSNKKDRVPLKDAVTLMVAKAKFLNYADAYKMVHQFFGVDHIDEIPLERLPEAVAYVHHLMGEYVQKVERIDPETKSFNLLAAKTTSAIMDYLYDMNREIKRLGGEPPAYPDFDKETIVRQ